MTPHPDSRCPTCGAQAKYWPETEARERAKLAARLLGITPEDFKRARFPDVRLPGDLRLAAPQSINGDWMRKAADRIEALEQGVGRICAAIPANSDWGQQIRTIGDELLGPPR